jgi:rhodanese-related sulfurtransferase
MKKIIIFSLIVFLTFTITYYPTKAENAKLLAQTTLIIPVTSETFRQINIPFNQILDTESTFQIKVTKELPKDYGLKIGLVGKYIQKEWETETLQPGFTDNLIFRIFCPKEIQQTEINSKIIIGATEDSNISSIINLYLQPVEKKEIHLTINKMQAIVNGKTITLDASPLILKSRTFVPFRFIGTEFGAKIDYTINSKTKLVDTVTFKLGRKSIKLFIGDNIVEITNDQEKIVKNLDAPPVILKGRTLIPLRFVSEELGSNITWDPITSSIGVYFPQNDIKPDDNGNIFYKLISSDDLSKMLIDSREQVFVIDIRVPSEYAKSHIPTAMNIYETDINEQNLTEKGITKTDKIVLYCNSGLRSVFFCELLTNLGYTNVNNLSKGFAGWRYPTEK